MNDEQTRQQSSKEAKEFIKSKLDPHKLINQFKEIILKKMSNDLISVIMSSFNSEKTIEDSIQSILNQDYKNIEFLIVDDGSTDNTLRIMKKLRDKDERIKIIENTRNIGLTKIAKSITKNF